MVRTIRSVLIAAVAALLCGPGQAQSPINTVGLGAEQCQSVLERLVRDALYVEAIAEWSFGFYSGANIASIISNGRYKDIRMFTTGSYAEAVLPIISRCRADPSRRVIQVAEEVYALLPDIQWE